MVTFASSHRRLRGITRLASHSGTTEPTAVHALVSCRVGEVGIAVLAEDGSTPVASEAIVPAGVTRLVTALLDGASEPGRWLMIRNGRGSDGLRMRRLRRLHW